VTRGRLPQRAGSVGLNDGGAAAAVPPGINSFFHMGSYHLNTFGIMSINWLDDEEGWGDGWVKIMNKF